MKGLRDCFDISKDIVHSEMTRLHSGQVSLFLLGHLSVKVRNTGYIIVFFMNPSLQQTFAECEAWGHMR